MSFLTTLACSVYQSSDRDTFNSQGKANADRYASQGVIHNDCGVTESHSLSLESYQQVPGAGPEVMYLYGTDRCSERHADRRADGHANVFADRRTHHRTHRSAESVKTPTELSIAIRFVLADQIAWCDFVFEPDAQGSFADHLSFSLQETRRYLDDHPQ